MRSTAPRMQCRDLGDRAQALRLWRQALTIYADLDLPQADEVRDLLATASPDDVHY